MRQDLLAFGWFQLLGCFTMFPLLRRDGLVTCYVAVIGLFVAVCGLEVDVGDGVGSGGVVGRAVARDDARVILGPVGRLVGSISALRSSGDNPGFTVGQAKRVFVYTSAAGMAVLHALEALLPNPYQHRLPHLYPALFSLYGCGNLCVMFLYSLRLQGLVKEVEGRENERDGEKEE